MHPTIADTLELSAGKYPERDALVYPRKDQRWTYGEFDERANRLANALADRGVEHGDRVSTLLFNGTEIVLTVYACAKLGAVFNPLNYRLKAGEVAFILNDAESSLVVFEDATREALEGARESLDTVETSLTVDGPASGGDVSGDLPEYAEDFYAVLDEADAGRPETDVAEDDVYAFIYTSGTTGRPKGVVHEHRSMVEHSVICVAESGLTKSDVGLSCLPLYHCAELHANLFPRVHVGATSVVHHDFDPVAVLGAIEDHGVTQLFAAPTAWNALAQTAPEVDADVSTLDIGFYGAAPMPERVLDACREQFTENYLQAYGMTEIGPCGTFQHPDEQVPKQGSAGLPALNHDLRVVTPDGHPSETVERGDVGEVLFAGPCTMREYWNRPEATERSLREADGKTWYYSGDLGYRDEDGYLYVVDRKDDMIVSGGENIYPTEVEDVLFGHDEVVEAAVVGQPDEEWGELVTAYVVADGDVTAEELDAFCKTSDDLAEFKRPRAYEFVEELPKNPSGKVQKFKLRDSE
ncbi:long-chain-fatty-acid--CoA ligase [Halomarina oriensis]|uniref:Long-chain-fatty-acid--CoA ligase n=1 Tax=Halomarina oriensis TaxID=671145 RepID=A0A6B0GM74_9EURY|nr:long-chain-fatty-acid--CoA ligase [Halomarina oriensis]MWG35996.1 long-chain-fatty-acid--CoA ligase [Halomarina oriensis]